MVTAGLGVPGPTAAPVNTPVLTQVAEGVRVIVTGLGGTISDATRTGIESLGGAVVADLPLIGALVAEVPARAAADLTQLPGVAGVAVDEVVELQDGSGDPTAAADATGPQALGADRVWSKGYDGTGIGIAVIDTGVSEIADLAGRVRGGVDLSPEQDGLDGYGHGTPIAWLAAGDGAASDGAYTGVAPGAHIVPVKIAGRDGQTEVARLLLALDWVARYADEYDIRVVNLSLGSTPAAVDLVDAAVQRLWDLGLVVVVAAGNNGPDTMGTPAANTHVITVGSSQGNGTRRVSDDVIAPWSATGVDADGVSKPDVVAPGQSLVVAGAPGSWAYETHTSGHLGNGYQRASGTSFSTGLISGAAALMLDAHPDWTPDEVLGQLHDRARSVDGSQAPSPWLPRALKIEDPAQANTAASASNLGATAVTTDALMAMGPMPPDMFGIVTGNPLGVATMGTGWYGTGWYGTGWYAGEWFGTGWYGTGWYAASLSGTGWYGTGWYGTGWYGTGWYGTGWYGTGWYGTGWYGSGWA